MNRAKRLRLKIEKKIRMKEDEIRMEQEYEIMNYLEPFYKKMEDTNTFEANIYCKDLEEKEIPLSNLMFYIRRDGFKMKYLYNENKCVCGITISC